MRRWLRLAGSDGRRLSLRNSLFNGQVFDWEPRDEDVDSDESSGGSIDEDSVRAADVAVSAPPEHRPIHYVGALPLKGDLNSQIPVALSQADDTQHVYFKALSEGTDECALTETMLDYFRMDEDIDALYKAWEESTPDARESLRRMRGMRLLRQHPLSCLIGFICSSNNNIKRISEMTRKFRVAFGAPLEGGVHAWPSLEVAKRDVTAERLAELGFGYRSKYVYGTIQAITSISQLTDLIDPQSSHLLKRKALVVFPGVGPKVADCVSIFSLDDRNAIPVDTHVLELARRFDPTLREIKSLTPTIYERIGDLFRLRMPDYPAWGHSVLFATELPEFKSRKRPREG